MSWPTVFIIFACLILAALMVLPFMRSTQIIDLGRSDETLTEVLNKAFRDPTYCMIFLGFFSCGFQLGFLTAHFPAYITEICTAIPTNSILQSLGVESTSSLGAFSIALIGVANIFGAIMAGALGKKYSKKYLLSAVYVGRTIIAAAFIMTPMTPTTVVIFSVSMGVLWLATVPLTSGLVAQIYGLRYMGTLYGIVFLSHQMGSFLGV